MFLSGNVRRTSIISGYLWLPLAFQLLLVATLFAIISPAAMVYAVLGIAALILAAILLTQAPTPLLFIVSTAGGLLSTLAGLLVASRPSLLPIALAVAYTAISAVVTRVSAIWSPTVRASRVTTPDALPRMWRCTVLRQEISPQDTVGA